MTCTREYSCNICHERIEPPFGGAEEGYGLRFTAHRKGAFTVSKVRDTEGSHICCECLETLAEFHKTLPGEGKDQ